MSGEEPASVGATMVLPERTGLTQPGMAVAGTLLEVFRSRGISGPVPADLDPTPGLVKYLNAAKTEIVFAIFSLTSQPIADALIAAKRRGVKMRGLADTKQWGPVNDAVVQAAIDLERAVKQHACMHLKVAVIDGHIVALGSFNWTSNAELHNDEVLLLCDSKPLADVLVAQIDAARKANLGAAAPAGLRQVDVSSVSPGEDVEAETESAAATATQQHAYGWVPDVPDQRDYLYAAPAEFLGQLPRSVDLRPQCPPVYDQGDLQSCTANAIAAAFQFDQMKEKLPKPFMPSRLFIWYNERFMEGSVASNVGASLRDGIKTVAKQGVCPEDEWKYDDALFATKPSDPCFQDALKNRAVSYQRVAQSLTQMKGCLASGYPFVFGFAVYDSFESDVVKQSGDVPLPGPTEARLGGHAVMAVGYDDTRQVFIVRNSWGPSWGAAGYCYMPYAYLSQAALSNDFWTVRLVIGAAGAAAPQALAGAKAGG